MSGAPPLARLAPAARDVADALGFFTRLPLTGADARSLDFDRIAWAAPVAGAIIGLIGAAVLALTAPLGLPALFRSGLATAALVAAAGALHEDGLADAADGFGGGVSPAHKLEIMRDSRIGAYGAIALTLALILRVGALAAAIGHGAWGAAGALVLVSAVSRAGALAPLALLVPARSDGAGAAAGRLKLRAFAAAWGVALVVAVALGMISVGVGRAFAAVDRWRNGRCGDDGARAAANRRADRRRRRRRPTMVRNRGLVRDSHRPVGRIGEADAPPRRRRLSARPRGLSVRPIASHWLPRRGPACSAASAPATGRRAPELEMQPVQRNISLASIENLCLLSRVRDIHPVDAGDRTGTRRGTI